MINNELLRFLERLLGVSRHTSGDNYSFFSPFKTHYKPKLEIKLTTNEKNVFPWHCWISNQGGRSIKSLLAKMGCGPEWYEELSKIINSRAYYEIGDSVKLNKAKFLALPSGYIPLFDNRDDKWEKYNLRYALKWLHNRNVTDTDIYRYQIGYCVEGKYSGRVIIPSFDANNNLNYYTGRTLFEDDQLKYKNPKVSKDIIGFENMIDWNQPVYLTEGVFDAITLRKNAIPMFGKTPSRKLQSALMLHRPDVWVCLDADAEEEARKLVRKLMESGLNVYFYKVSGKDINEIGFNKAWETKMETKQYEETDLLKELIAAA